MQSKALGTETLNAPRYTMSGRRAGGEPVSRRLPQVRGGTCEFCGVLDPNVPAEYQYKFCPHFRGLELACMYCDEAKNPVEVVGHSTLNIAEHPYNRNELIVWCNSYECSEKHLKEWKKNR